MTAINHPGSAVSQKTAAIELKLCSKFIFSVVFLCLTLLQNIALAAGNAPPAHEATPKIYKILAENDQFRVIEAIWQPGQEDNYHSHPADRVSLYQTDCTLRLTNFDGSSRIGKPKANTAKARSGKPVKSHKVKNIGDQVCVIRIVELK
jgi:hypothetical protein